MRIFASVRAYSFLLCGRSFLEYGDVNMPRSSESLREYRSRAIDLHRLQPSSRAWQHSRSGSMEHCSSRVSFLFSPQMRLRWSARVLSAIGARRRKNEPLFLNPLDLPFVLSLGALIAVIALRRKSRAKVRRNGCWPSLASGFAMSTGTCTARSPHVVQPFERWSHSACVSRKIDDQVGGAGAAAPGRYPLMGACHRRRRRPAALSV